MLITRDWRQGSTATFPFCLSELRSTIEVPEAFSKRWKWTPTHIDVAYSHVTSLHVFVVVIAVVLLRVGRYNNLCLVPPLCQMSAMKPLTKGSQLCKFLFLCLVFSGLEPILFFNFHTAGVRAAWKQIKSCLKKYWTSSARRVSYFAWGGGRNLCNRIRF